MKSEVYFSDNVETFYMGTQKIIDDVIESHDLPPRSVLLYSNASTKGVNIGQETSKSICFSSTEYPAPKNKSLNPKKSYVVMRIVDLKDGSVDLYIRDNQYSSIVIPESAFVKDLKSDKNIKQIIFRYSDASVFLYIKQNIEFCLANYAASDSFGCCSKYIECSDSHKCLHENKMYAMRCKYRANLESGKIFYGKNKNM